MAAELPSVTVATAMLAVFGAVLGGTLWRVGGRARVRLRVRPTAWIPRGPGGAGGPAVPLVPLVGVEVVNLSALPVTVCEVGLYLDGRRRRAVPTPPVLPDGGPFPRRLDAGAQVRVYFPPHEPPAASLDRARRVYARAASGEERSARVRRLGRSWRALLDTA
jgi:hypothetical protein